MKLTSNTFTPSKLRTTLTTLALNLLGRLYIGLALASYAIPYTLSLISSIKNITAVQRASAK